MCAAVQLDSFVLENKQRTVRRFFDDFTQPAIVRIIEVDEDFKLSAPHFARNAVSIAGSGRQKVADSITR